MNHRCLRLLATFWIAALAGCGVTASFKPGAVPSTMEADDKACRQGEVSEAAFLECMRGRGWYMSGPKAAVPSAAAPAAPVAAPAAAPIAPAGPLPVPSPTPSPASKTTPPPTAVVPAPNPAAEVAQPPAAPPAGSETLPRVHVGSWWKIGGTAGGLDASIAACVHKLGPPHQPNPGATVVTVALRDCLREDGWIAYDESPVQ